MILRETDINELQNDQYQDSTLIRIIQHLCSTAMDDSTLFNTFIQHFWLSQHFSTVFNTRRNILPVVNIHDKMKPYSTLFNTYAQRSGQFNTFQHLCSTAMDDSTLIQHLWYTNICAELSMLKPLLLCDAAAGPSWRVRPRFSIARCAYNICVISTVLTS
jgi:hypothetical protein